MKLVFSEVAWADYLFWLEQGASTLHRINALVNDTLRAPFAGIGKPEPLVGNLKGWWSRRITREHRLVYRVSGAKPNQFLEIAACRFHYGP